MITRLCGADATILRRKFEKDVDVEEDEEVEEDEKKDEEIFWS